MSPAIGVGLDLRFLCITPPPGWEFQPMERLIAARMAAKLTIADAAAALGMDELDYAAVERQKRVFLDPEGIEAAIEVMRGVR